MLESKLDYIHKRNIMPRNVSISIQNHKRFILNLNSQLRDCACALTAYSLLNILQDEIEILEDINNRKAAQ